MASRSGARGAKSAARRELFVGGLGVALAVLLGSNTDCVALLKADTNADGNVNGNDIPGFTDALVP